MYIVHTRYIIYDGIYFLFIHTIDGISNLLIYLEVLVVLVVVLRHVLVCTRVVQVLRRTTVFILIFFKNTHVTSAWTSEENTINTRFKYNVVTHIF
jgi:hypothetical protein